MDIQKVAALLGEQGQAGYESFTIEDVRIIVDRLDFRVTARSGRPARLRIGLPESGDRQHWLYTPALSDEDWVGQLLAWIEEEVGTGGLRDSRVREQGAIESYVCVEPYGWRLSSKARHRDLLLAAGEDGWYGPIS